LNKLNLWLKFSMLSSNQKTRYASYQNFLTIWNKEKENNSRVNNKVKQGILIPSYKYTNICSMITDWKGHESICARSNSRCSVRRVNIPVVDSCAALLSSVSRQGSLNEIHSHTRYKSQARDITQPGKVSWLNVSL